MYCQNWCILFVEGIKLFYFILFSSSLLRKEKIIFTSLCKKKRKRKKESFSNLFFCWVLNWRNGMSSLLLLLYVERVFCVHSNGWLNYHWNIFIVNCLSEKRLSRGGGGKRIKNVEQFTLIFTTTKSKQMLRKEINVGTYHKSPSTIHPKRREGKRDRLKLNEEEKWGKSENYEIGCTWRKYLMCWKMAIYDFLRSRHTEEYRLGPIRKKEAARISVRKSDNNWNFMRRKQHKK